MAEAGTTVFLLPRLGFGGAERVAADIMGYLRTRGIPVATLALDGDETPGSAAGAWFAPLGPVLRLPRRPRSDAIIDLLRTVGVDTLALCGKSAAFDLVPAIRAALPGIRITSFVFNARQLIAETRRLAHHLDQVIVESSEAAAHLQLGREAVLNLEIVSSGVPASRLAARPRPARGGEPLTVAFVGRFDRTKNPAAFTAIARRLRNRPYRFIMAGPMPRFFRLPRNVAGTGLLLGEALEALMDRVDMLVVPSRNDGRPLAIQEAQAHGVVVVASAVGGIPELVEHGETGLLCPPGDVSAFCDAIDRLAADPMLRAGLVARARARVLAEGEVGRILPRYAAAIMGRPVAA